MRQEIKPDLVELVDRAKEIGRLEARLRVVAWLRAAAKNSFGSAAGALKSAAKAIEAGEHLK